MSASLGEALLASGAVSAEQLRNAQALQRNRGLDLASALGQVGGVDEGAVARVVAREAGLPFVDLAKAAAIRPALLARVPREVALEQRLLPVAERNGRLVIAVDDPARRMFVDQLQFALGCDAACAIAAPAALSAALARAYGEAQAEAALGVRIAAEPEEAPVVRLVARLFQDALDARASDIHLEPMNGGLRVRLRVDGMLRTVAEHPLHLAGPIVSRLKILGSMDIAEKRKPQDGRIELELGGRSIDVRASILPGSHGETVVLRLLDRTRSLISLRGLGLEDEQLAWFGRMIRRPHGIVLVTGPTGSGKTTTLYAALSELNRPDVKIITAEDPVEYHLAGVNQLQVNARIGLSFARILKAMLRAAPNVILVGEIRDRETAEVAIQAALTGHLVFSTLHTNDAPSAITRLIDMGVAPFLVSAAVQGVVAQRLVRRLCAECSQSAPAAPEELRALRLDPQHHAGRKLRRARGCRACDGTGYRGRVGLYEIMELDAALRELVFSGSSADDIRGSARAAGQLSDLLEDGARKVLAGATSSDEVLRVTRAAMQSENASEAEEARAARGARDEDPT